MATITSFTDILAWQKARGLSKGIYVLTCSGTFARDFGLKDQINRATGSIMDNIAEGFERGGSYEFVNFLSYAKASAGETISQLFRAWDRRHISEDEFNKLKLDAEEIGRLIASLMSYLNRTNIRGQKFKGREQQTRN
jgi:four helix bundle protein